MTSLSLTTFLAGVGAGLFVAVPIGPMGVLCIQRTLTFGLAAGLATGLGAAIAFRSASAMVLGALVARPGILLTPARRLIGAEPGRDLVRGAIAEATLAAVARHPTVLIAVVLAPVAAILALAAVAAAPVPRAALAIAAVVVAPVASAAVVASAVVS